MLVIVDRVSLQARAQQQEGELAVATSRITELEEQVSSLEQLLAADSGPFEAEVSNPQHFHALWSTVLPPQTLP